MAEEDVVGGSLDAGRVLHCYESHVVDEGPQDTEAQLCGDKEGSFVPHLYHVWLSSE